MNFMLHFVVAIFKVCFEWLPPPVASDSTFLVTLNISVTNCKNEYVKMEIEIIYDYTIL